MATPLVLLAGLPGTGKSTIARVLARALGGHVLDKDPIRQALFDRLVEYSTAQDDFVATLMFQTAGWLHERDPERVLFLDGRTWSQRYQRDAAGEAAGRIGMTLRILECVCREDTALARLEHDIAARSHPAANRDAELYRRVRSHFEPVDEPKCVLDTDLPLKVVVEQARWWLGIPLRLV